MAPRPSPTSERGADQPLSTRLVVAGLVALALLGLGEAAPGAALVEVAIEAHGAQLSVDVDGQRHELTSGLGGGWHSVAFESPGPVEREYQIDGSDTTSTNDRRPALVLELLHTPLYAVDAWLRDEASYSRWERGVVADLTGPAAAPPDAAQPAARLPAAFRLTAALRRPEAAARVWLLGAEPGTREGLELDRDHRNARWLIDRQGSVEALPRWFFPEQPWPFAAELLQLLGRSAAAGFALVLAGLLLGTVARIAARAATPAERVEPSAPRGRNVAGSLRRWAAAARFGHAANTFGEAALALWLLGAVLLSTFVYHQQPHILDAVSYTFQAGIFSRGALWLDAPPGIQAFRGPFEVVWLGHWFSQYPPGAPAAYALGELVGLSWLVGPLAALTLLGATAWTAGALWGSATGLVVLLLGTLSPFVLFQSGSFLSHPIAGGLLGGALASFVAGERAAGRRPYWFMLCGGLLGAAFVTREVAGVLFGLPLAARLVSRRRRRELAALLVSSVPFLLLYLVYNDALTGSPWTLPRSMFDPSDRFGFGDGIGFHTRHTLAAGLANADELLTLLQFDALGWPPLFLFGLLGLPFLVGRARAWEYVALGGLLAFVLTYIGYFYHGVALGPRYYFEAMPWLLLLAGRGAQVLAALARSRLAAGLLLGLLALNTVAFYLPAELERRRDFSGLPDARPLRLAFVSPSLRGPRLEDVPGQSLVLTSDWWLYNAELAALNCPSMPNCSVLFGLVTSNEQAEQLRSAFPERTLLGAVEAGGRIILQAAPAELPSAGSGAGIDH